MDISLQMSAQYLHHAPVKLVRCRHPPMAAKDPLAGETANAQGRSSALP